MGGKNKSGRTPNKSKPTPKKQQQHPLVAILTAKTQSPLPPQPQDDINLNATILECLANHDQQTLKTILQIYSHQEEVVKSVAKNIVQSRVGHFFEQLVRLVQEDPEESYLFPWLAELYSIHPHKLAQSQVKVLLQKIQPSREWQSLLRLQGKISILEYQHS